MDPALSKTVIPPSGGRSQENQKLKFEANLRYIMSQKFSEDYT